MPLFDAKTDPRKEEKGVPLDFGDYRITIRRAGGSNNAFSLEYARQTKKYKRIIKMGKLPKEKDKEIIYLVYANSIVGLWETCLETLPEKAQTPELVAEAEGNGGFVKGIDFDGTLKPCTPDNLVELFNLIPDLFFDVQEISNDGQLFREREEDSKN